MELIKTILTFFIRNAMKVFFLFKMRKNRVVFYPANGHYYCNLKYLDKYICEYRAGLQVVWISANGKDVSYPDGVSYFARGSLQAAYYICTAHVVIFNDMLPSYYPKRNGQVRLDTWHGGGAYKGMAASYRNHPSAMRRKRLCFMWENMDYIVSACEKFTEAYSADTEVYKHNPKVRFLKSGMPRNDIFFDEEKYMKAVKRVKTLYHIEENSGVAIYMPTFRDNGMKNDFDVERVLAVLEARFGKPFILLLRSHPHIQGDIFASTRQTEKLIDVSAYPDAQELLCAADVLFTDYSSCMWDFSLSHKPCFIYANDISGYSEERGFHTPMSAWPFPVARNNDELCGNILEFREEVYQEKVRGHHEVLGSYENGHACERICQVISKICEEE